MLDPGIQANIFELAGGEQALGDSSTADRLQAAQAVLRLLEDEQAMQHGGTASITQAACECLPGLVAALGSEEEPVWRAALRLLELAVSRDHGSECSCSAIVAAGGVQAVAQLGHAHRDDQSVQHAVLDFVMGMMRGPELYSALVAGGAIPALAHGARAADASDALAPTVALTTLVCLAPSRSSSTSQLLETGVAPHVLRLLAGMNPPNAAVRVLSSIRELNGWPAALAAAEQAAKELPAGSCGILAAVLEAVFPEGVGLQHAGMAHRSMRRRLRSLLPRLQAATNAPPLEPLPSVTARPPSPAQLAAAEEAAEAAAAALLQEEEEQAEQRAERQAAKAAGKAAKRQRQRERQQAAAAAAASAAAEAAVAVETAETSAAAAAVESEMCAEEEHVLPSGFAATGRQTEQAATGGQLAAAGSAGGSSGGTTGRSKKQRRKKGKQMAAGAAPVGGTSGGTSGAAGRREADSGAAAADQQAPAAVQSETAPAEPDAAELEQLMQQLGLGAAPEGSGSRGRTSTATPEPVSCDPPAPPAAPPASSAATPARQPFDPSLLSDLCCPITHEPMADPVVVADGGTYERAAIEGGRLAVCLGGRA